MLQILALMLEMSAWAEGAVSRGGRTFFTPRGGRWYSGLIAIRIVVIGSAVSSCGFVDVRLAALDRAYYNQSTPSEWIFDGSTSSYGGQANALWLGRFSLTLSIAQGRTKGLMAGVGRSSESHLAWCSRFLIQMS